MTTACKIEQTKRRKLTIGNSIVVSWLLVATWFIPAQIQIWQNRVTLEANQQASEAADARLESPEGRLEVVAAIRTQIQQAAAETIQKARSTSRGHSARELVEDLPTAAAAGEQSITLPLPIDIEVEEFEAGLRDDLEQLERTVERLNAYEYSGK